MLFALGEENIKLASIVLNSKLSSLKITHWLLKAGNFLVGQYSCYSGTTSIAQVKLFCIFSMINRANRVFP